MYGNPSNSGPSNIGNNMYGSNPDYGFNQMYNNQMSQNMYNNQMSQNMYNNHMNQNMYNYQMSQNPPNMNMYNFNNYNNMNMYNVNNYSYSNQNQQQEKIVLNKGTLKSSQAVSEDDFTEVVEDPQNKKGLNNLLDPKLVNLNNLNTKSKQHGKTKKEFNFY